MYYMSNRSILVEIFYKYERNLFLYLLRPKHDTLKTIIKILGHFYLFINHPYLQLILNTCQRERERERPLPTILHSIFYTYLIIKIISMLYKFNYFKFWGPVLPGNSSDLIRITLASTTFSGFKGKYGKGSFKSNKKSSIKLIVPIAIYEGEFEGARQQKN